MRTLAIAALGIALLVGRVAAAPDPDKKFVYSDKAMGTIITVFVWTDDETKAASGAASVFEEMKIRLYRNSSSRLMENEWHLLIWTMKTLVDGSGFDLI